MKETEFEKQQLEQLISDLKDIDKYTSFKNGAFIYDLGKYQGSLLVNEIERLNNIINEFEEWLKSNFWNDDEGNESYQIEKYTTFYSVYRKLDLLKTLNKGDENETNS